MPDNALTDADYAEIRGVMVEFAMPDTCTIIKPGTPVPDGMGGERPGVPTEVQMPCNSAPNMKGGLMGASEAILSGLSQGEVPWTVILPYMAPDDPNLPTRESEIRDGHGREIEIMSVIVGQSRQFNTKILGRLKS